MIQVVAIRLEAIAISQIIGRISLELKGLARKMWLGADVPEQAAQNSLTTLLA